jgi:hypothetical protein
MIFQVFVTFNLDQAMARFEPLSGAAHSRTHNNLRANNTVRTAADATELGSTASFFKSFRPLGHIKERAAAVAFSLLSR